ncbi:MAG: transglutaminase-like domain-containing protein [Planctomycetota bacterium]
MLLAILVLLTGACGAKQDPTAPVAGFSAPTLGPDDVIEQEQWLVGTLDGEPMANTHIVLIGHPDGSRTAQSDMRMVLNRMMMGQRFALQISETSRIEESPDGRIVAFRFTNGQLGSQTAAIGRVEADRVVGTIHRNGQPHPVELELAPEVELLSQEAMQRRLEALAPDPDQEQVFHSLVLVQSFLRIITTRITCTGVDGELRHFRMRMDQMPGATIDFTIDGDAMVQHMRMAMGSLAIVFTPADGPARLGEAELATVGQIETAGPPPRAAMINRYRLPAATLEALPAGPFQRRTDDLLVVRSRAQGHPPADRAALLAPEPHLETGHPDLQNWVHDLLADAPPDVGQRAEILRVAVRSRLTGDLTKGDLTAAEAFAAGRGDCTEHANLLVTALRIAGIPARVEVGFVYAAALGGWGGHAWVSAWSDDAGGWIHLDAAYPNVTRSCYIRTGSVGGDGSGSTTGGSLDNGISLLMGRTIEVVPEAE